MGAVTGTATVVFTDLADSTALRARLGEQAADVVRREHDHALGEVVSDHHGRIVKATGDGVMAAFDSASDATAAAVAMHRAVERLARQRRLPLAIRVGISAGDVSWEDGDCFGLPVVEAARLEAAAEAGHILCADIVRVLTRGRAGVAFRPVGALPLKGLDEPVAACEVEWQPEDHGVAQLPRCVGRERELALLDEVWARTRGGPGGVVLVAGEPGIGKTRLLTEFADEVRSGGGTVWWGTAYEGDVRAYGPLSQLLDDAAHTASLRHLQAWLGSSAALVARVAPAMRALVGGMDEPAPVPVDVERERTEDAVVEFVAAAARVAPLLVVVDDAHWADPSTVRMVRTLARRAARLPLLVVVAYRDVELDRQHPLAAVLPGLRREPYARRIVLSGLDNAGVAELVGDLAEHSPPDELVSALVAETLGNPFFVREVALHLVEEGHVRPDEEAWTVSAIETLDIPEGVREVIGRRLSRLSADANRLLRVAAAFEAGFDLADAAAVAGVGEGAALDAVEEALAARILVPTDTFDTYQFTHALFRHTLWSEWSPSRQVRLHRAIAEQLEKRLQFAPSPGQALVLARHYRESSALPGAERGVAYAVAAADDAAARFAAAEEYEALAMALELLPDDDDRTPGLHERAARAGILMGNRTNDALQHAQAAVSAMAERTGPTAAAHLAVKLGLLANGVQLHAAWPFGHLADPYRAALAEASQEAVQLLAWTVDEAEYLDPDNPGIAVDSPARRRMNLLAQGLAPEQRPAEYLEPSAVALYERTRNHADMRSWGSSVAGRQRQAAAELRSSIDGLLRLGVVGPAVHGLGNLGRLHLVLGELDRARAVQAEGEQYLPRVEPGSNNANQFAALEIFRRLLTGADPEPTLALFNQMVTTGDRPDFRWVSGPVRLGRPPLLAELGGYDEAVAALTDDMPVLERAALGAPNLPMALHWACRTVFLCEHTALVPRLERVLFTKVIKPDFCYGESDSHWDAALLAALQGRDDDARGWFQRSYDRLIEQEAIALVPHVACDEAFMEFRLGERGDRGNALRRVDEGRRMAEHIGLHHLVERADELARRFDA